MMDSFPQSESDFDDPKNDPQLDELCFQMLERASKSRSPCDQIIVGSAKCELAAVVQFVEPGRGEEYADWLESIDVYLRCDEDEGEPTVPWEQIKAEIELRRGTERG
jgi:hypothetical protein